MTQMMQQETAGTEVATLGGGCFWCLEAVYLDMEGVLEVQSGYTGGHTDRPTYREVCEGDTGHVEVVRVVFDPARIGYRDVLEVFFAIHDPTTRDRQGNDVGSQYRSAIFFHDTVQDQVARDVVAELTRDRVFAAPIVTEILAAPVFHAAEDYHRDYLARNPHQPYCQFVVAPKLAKFRSAFPQRSRGRGLA